VSIPRSELARSQAADRTSSNLPEKSDKGRPLYMNRRYIDANRVSYQFHTHTKHSTFDTVSTSIPYALPSKPRAHPKPLGQNITSNLVHLATALNISTPLGHAPIDLYLARYPYGHRRSALTVWTNEVLPATVIDKERRGRRIIIGNTGSLRFDLVS
jgi:hypothetical protein